MCAYWWTLYPEENSVQIQKVTLLFDLLLNYSSYEREKEQ